MEPREDGLRFADFAALALGLGYVIGLGLRLARQRTWQEGYRAGALGERLRARVAELAGAPG